MKSEGDSLPLPNQSAWSDACSETGRRGMHIVDVQEMISRTQDAATVKRVYGDPYEKGDVTIIPVARVSARGGSGTARGGEHSGGRL